MDRPHYVHSDLFVYVTKNPNIIKNSQSPAEIIDKAFYAMMSELEELSNGQVVVPTYNYQFTETKIFNLKHDASEVGQFSELFRKKFINSRTNVPIFSNCTSFDGFFSTEPQKIIDPFGPSSDFDKLEQANGVIVNYGSSFGPTFMIFIEKQVNGGAVYRYEKQFSGQLVGLNNTQSDVVLTNYVRPRQIDIKYDLDKVEADLLKQSILTKHTKPSGFSYSSFSARDFLEFARNEIKRDPLYFLTKDTKEVLVGKGIFTKTDFDIKEFD